MSADALPTVQIDGVVWSTVVVGRTVYATGSFAKARPAGAPLGTSETARGNLLAFDLDTGRLDPGFDHSLYGAGLAVTASPDGRTVYVGGDFTSVDGQSRGHVAAFDTASGALTPFAPVVSGSVAALTASDTALYVGGTFTKAGSATRSNGVAFARSDGALLPWAPNTDAAVTALTLSPDGTRVVVGGRFASLDGTTRRGLGAVDTDAGAAVSWTEPPIRNYGLNSAITSLTHDGELVYGTGYNFNSNGGTGNFEGRFAIRPDGTVAWIDDCHGDSYSMFVSGGVAYSAGHSHNCATQGAFPETNPRTWHRALATTTTATGTVQRNRQSGYYNFAGQPAPSQLAWYPAMSSGSYTGAYQGPWAVSGNADYVVMGGEFPKVNNKGQQGLVRYAVRSIAPGKIGPDAAPTALTPQATALTSGARLNWTATSDNDDPELTYEVFRDDGPVAVGRLSVASRFWSLPTVSYTDTSAPTGRHTYRVTAVDPTGNAVGGGRSNAVDVVNRNPNAAPTASYVSSCTALDCRFDASGSADPDGRVTDYRWSFGDGGTAAGANVTHSFTAAGTYPVTLTVTDNGGATGQRVSQVTVASAATPGVLARDTFARSVAGGFGTADTGGSWTVLNGADRQSVRAGSAAIAFTASGQSAAAVLASVSSARTVLRATFALDKVVSGGGAYVYLTGRRVANGDQYRAAVRVASTGAVDAWVSAVVGGTERVIGRAQLAGITYRPGLPLTVTTRVTGTGTTALTLRVTTPDDAAAGSPQLSVTDSEASLQRPGAVGLSGYVSGSAGNLPATLRFSDLLASVP